MGSSVAWNGVFFLFSTGGGEHGKGEI